MKHCLGIFLLVYIVFQSIGQDKQYSQYYANPFYTNPSLVGSGDNTRIIFNNRYQWPSLQGNFTSFSFAMDHYFPSANSGIGAYVSHDRIAQARIKSNEFGLAYNYTIALNEYWNFRPSLMFSMVNQQTDFSDLTFNDQFSNQGFNGLASLENFGSNAQKTFADISSGFLFYNDKWWFGTSIFHMNRPNQSFLSNGDSKLAVKYSFQAGYKVLLSKYNPYAERMGTAKEMSFTPSMLFKSQGKFDQLDLGAYFYLQPIILGVWYRGLPVIKSSFGYLNNESIIALIGYRENGFQLAYSYDYTISKLTNNSGGSHEISLIYEFRWGEYLDKNNGRQARAQSPKNVRKLPCPKF